MHALRRERLENGLPVIFAPLPHLHTVQVVFSVRAGSRFESPRDSGLSHVVEHMLFRGSEARPSSAALNLAVEEIGGTLEAATHVDFTELSLSLPASQLEEGLVRLAEIVAAPVFADFEVEKKILREELLDDLDDEGRDVDVDNFARRRLFGSHPLGQSITGPIDNVMGFSVDDLRRHHQAHYTAKNSALAIASSGARSRGSPPARASSPSPRPPSSRARASTRSSTRTARPTCASRTSRRANTIPPRSRSTWWSTSSTAA